MKKKYQSGFLLVETLVVTTFISGIFVFLFIQFNNLNKSYKTSFNYDTIEGKYTLEDIIDYIKYDNEFNNNKDNYINSYDYILLNNCDYNLFTNVNYCKKLFEIEEIKEAILVKADFEYNDELNFDETIKEYLKKIKKDNTEDLNYLIVISLKNNTVTSKYINL